MRRKKFMSEDDLIGDLKGRNLVEPSRRILAEAIALGGRLAPARKGLVAWIAELLFDSGLAPATASVRNGAAASERILAKDGNSIVLDGVPMPARKGRPASR